MIAMESRPAPKPYTLNTKTATAANWHTSADAGQPGSKAPRHIPDSCKTRIDSHVSQDIIQCLRILFATPGDRRVYEMLQDGTGWYRMVPDGTGRYSIEQLSPLHFAALKRGSVATLDTYCVKQRDLEAYQLFQCCQKGTSSKGMDFFAFHSSGTVPSGK